MRTIRYEGKRSRRLAGLLGAIAITFGIAGMPAIDAQRNARSDQAFGMQADVGRLDWKTWLHLNKERYRTAERIDLRAIGLTEATPGATSDPVEDLVAKAIARAATSRNPLVRGQAVFALGLRQDRMTSRDRRLIDRALDASNPAVRNRAILAAGLSRRPEAIPGLIAILRDRAPEEGVTSEVNDRQQGLAAIALGLIGGERAVLALAKAVHTPRKPRSARAAAIAALGYAALRGPTGDATQKAHRALTRVIRDRKHRDDMRSLALIALARWGGPEATRVVTRMARDTDVMIRRAAMFATGALVEADDRLMILGYRSPPSVYPELASIVRERLDDASMPVQTAALLAYASLADRAGNGAIEAIRAKLDDDNVTVRTYAAFALARAARGMPTKSRDELIDALRQMRVANLDQQAALDVAVAIAGGNERPTVQGAGAIRLGSYAALAHQHLEGRPTGLTDDGIELLRRVRNRIERHNVIAGLGAVQPSRDDLKRLRPKAIAKRNSPEMANRLSVLAWWHDAPSVRRASRLVANEKFPVVDRVLLIETLGQSIFAESGDPLGALGEWHDPALNFATLDYVLTLKW